MQIKSTKDLIVYQKAYALAMEAFVISKGFPAEEKYSLIDQIRRSSRSVVQTCERHGQEQQQAHQLRYLAC
jgi:four helix bundle protein